MIVYVTCGSGDEAEKLSNLIVENRLAACVNIIDAVSIYRWNNKLEKAGEKLLIIKTENSRYKELEQIVKKNHSYECPEILALEVKTGSTDYIRWVHSSVN